MEGLKLLFLWTPPQGLNGRSWLEYHLETFVRPVIGEIPNEKEYINQFSVGEMSLIKNAWRSVKKKAKGKRILLPGRDVCIFEILARRENYPTLFIPECSRQTVGIIAQQMSQKEVDELFVFDTGFFGTIPKMLRSNSFSLLSFDGKYNVEKQVFPFLRDARHLALKIEQTPKYWESGRAAGGAVWQPYSTNFEFRHAAVLTLLVYKDSSPSFYKRERGRLYA